MGKRSSKDNKSIPLRSPQSNDRDFIKGLPKVIGKYGFCLIEWTLKDSKEVLVIL